MTNQDILNCSFSLWYPNFHKNTTDSVILKIPSAFINYLLTDGLFLPDDGIQTNTNTRDSNHLDLDVIIDDHDECTEEEMKGKALFATKEFKDFISDVVDAIAELGGKVFPKLNWSSPKDASWIAINSSLCCENFNDVCLLLKSSDFIMHDLTQPFVVSGQENVENVVPAVEYVLALRKWLDVTPSGEYRCFVKNHRLIAISQRSQQHYSFIESSKLKIIENIHRFYKSRVHKKFPNSSYTFDIYLPALDTAPILLDFNPYQRITDGLMFSWDELDGTVDMPEVATENGVTSGIVFRQAPKEGMAGPDMRTYAYPVDFQHLTTGEDPAKLLDLLKLHQRTTSLNSTDTDSD